MDAEAVRLLFGSRSADISLGNVEAVHMLMEGSFTKPWSPNENRESRLVFIGRNIDELELSQQFDACIV